MYVLYSRCLGVSGGDLYYASYSEADLTLWYLESNIRSQDAVWVRKYTANLTNALVNYCPGLFQAEVMCVDIHPANPHIVYLEINVVVLNTKESLQKAFKMKDLGEVKYFLAKPAGTPIDVNVKLTSRQYDEQVESKRISEEPLVDQIMYQKLVGKLLYLNMTRPDISFSTQTLSQFLHMDAALRVVRYLKGQPAGQGLLFGSSSDGLITAFFVMLIRPLVHLPEDLLQDM
ncbi:hypothetical protein MTR67_021142 [Solanum verrucosum]|uniref:Uncharacterized protein n=1 Tax=Solanum verrucosum TaxID=315347 RepID=A0AAF0TPE0_SOLVR|nr:hypothetical protein MTR67_021142 [Solanum verrucosum]